MQTNVKMLTHHPGVADLCSSGVVTATICPSNGEGCPKLISGAACTATGEGPQLDSDTHIHMKNFLTYFTALSYITCVVVSQKGQASTTRFSAGALHQQG